LKKVTFIGNGNMAQAIINGLANHSYNIEVIGRDINKLKSLKKQIPTINIQILDDEFDITNKNIIFTVKPFNLLEVSQKLQGTANSFYSVLAGTTLEQIKKNVLSKHYIRVMPNVAAKFNRSMTTLTGDKFLKNDAINIFNCIGQTLWVDTQNELDIATAVAGSGPAFLAYFADAIIEGGIGAGLKKKDAVLLTTTLFKGFVPLLRDDEPKNIIQKVMSPNGTTQAGYDYLTQNNIKKHIKNTIQIAYNKALELASS